MVQVLARLTVYSVVTVMVVGGETEGVRVVGGDNAMMTVRIISECQGNANCFSVSVPTKYIASLRNAFNEITTDDKTMSFHDISNSIPLCSFSDALFYPRCYKLSIICYN